MLSKNHHSINSSISIFSDFPDSYQFYRVVARTFSRHEEMPIIFEKFCFINILKVQFHDFYLSDFISICEKQRLSFMALSLPNSQTIYYCLFVSLNLLLLWKFFLKGFNWSKRKSSILCSNVLCF